MTEQISIKSLQKSVDFEKQTWYDKKVPSERQKIKNKLKKLVIKRRRKEYNINSDY